MIDKKTMFYCHHFEEKNMWTKPTAQDMRFGFEITMYIANR
jgi:coenzyme PQQ precursor peptide PqqA